MRTLARPPRMCRMRLEVPLSSAKGASPDGHKVSVHATHSLHRRGERRCSAEKEKSSAQAKAMGRGADHGLALQMPRHIGSLRQECIQLPWADSVGLRPVLVSPPSSYEGGRVKVTIVFG